MNLTGVSIIRLQFDNFILQKNQNGWMLHRDGSMVFFDQPWEKAWESLTTHERSRCIVFANNLR